MEYKIEIGKNVSNIIMCILLLSMISHMIKHSDQIKMILDGTPACEKAYDQTSKNNNDAPFTDESSDVTEYTPQLQGTARNSNMNNYK